MAKKERGDKPDKKQEGTTGRKTGADSKKLREASPFKKFAKAPKEKSDTPEKGEKKFSKAYRPRAGSEGRPVKPKSDKRYGKKEGPSTRKPGPPTRGKSAGPRPPRPEGKVNKKDGNEDHSSGWKSEKDLAKDATGKGSRSQYRKVAGKTWKGKPVVQIRHTMRLNKYIANSGICSRREADDLIAQGLVEVNGKAVTEMGHQVKETDKVTYAGERINPEKPAYVLLNKPKDYKTSMKDPGDQKTVMMLLRKLGHVRITPVGSLNTATTGLLLFTNDGALAKKVTHPIHGVKKLYHVHLDKVMKAGDLKQLLEGVELEDGIFKAEAAEYVSTGKDKKQIGIEIKGGKNRVVRRALEHLGYKVIKLDRVTFGGLTKKDLPRGKWRHLTTQEVNMLKML